MTYQNDHANRQTAHGLRPLRVLVSKWISALLFYAARAGGWLGQRLCKSLCFYAACADLAKQRRQLAEMPQWQLRDIGIDPIAAKAAAEKSSWGAEPPWQKPQWANPHWKKQQWKKRQGQKPKRDRLVWRSFARR
jgi:uncharacterized protein YjiS (DUF1127 family)